MAGNFATKERFTCHWRQDWVVPSMFILGKPLKRPHKQAAGTTCCGSAGAAHVVYPVQQLTAVIYAVQRVAAALWRLHVPDMRATEDDVAPAQEPHKGGSVPSWANLSKDEVGVWV